MNPAAMITTGMARRLTIYFDIAHMVSPVADELPDADGQVPSIHLGLVNEGTTCYLNSLVQTLFFIREFRTAIYQVPTLMNGDDGEDSVCGNRQISFNLQRIFFNLQSVDQKKAVRTSELLAAFGWNGNQRYQQQDVSEFNCVLSDVLEAQMEETDVKGTYNRLFEGLIENVISCVNVDFESTR